MDNVVKKIRKWERVERGVNIGLVISVVWCLVWLLVLNNSPGGKATALLKSLSDACMFIVDHVLIWFVGFMFLVYLAIAAIGQMFGVNLGPKDHID